MPTSRAKSSLVSRNVTIAGHRTSVRLEPEMWAALQEIASREDRTLHAICTAVDERKGAEGSLTAAIRVFVMAYFRDAATDEGHRRAGHGAGGAEEGAGSREASGGGAINLASGANDAAA